MKTRKDKQLCSLAAIRNCIEADSPCSVKHVMHWAKSQGVGGSYAVKAIAELNKTGVIRIDNDLGYAVIELA